MRDLGIVGTHHVALMTANFARLLDFYTVTLGLPVLGGFPNERIVFLGAGMAAIELEEVATTCGADTGGWAHLALEVTNLVATHAALVARGVSFQSPPEAYPPGSPLMLIAFCVDPDGNVIELIQPLGDRYPAR